MTTRPVGVDPGLARILTPTPVVRKDCLDSAVGAQIFVKDETRQVTGSFKIRGCLNKVLRLDAEQLAGGLIAGSSGNHGRALAWAARRLGTRAVVVLPDDAPPTKVVAIRALGARIVSYDRYGGRSRQDVVAALAVAEGLTEVPSSDDWDVVVGQSTVVTELLAEVPDLDLIVVPVGGGGLAAGSCLAAEGTGVRIVGVEPITGDDTARALARGEICRVPSPDTIADGLRHQAPSAIPFGVLRRLMTSPIELVGDDEITFAMRLLQQTTGIVAEPSGACAAAVAGRLAGRAADPLRIGVVVSGGNIAPDDFLDLLGSSPAQPART